jgi:hypothetical protein
MSRLGSLWSKIEGSNHADCDSSNQQFFTHGTFLPSGDAPTRVRTVGASWVFQ